MSLQRDALTVLSQKPPRAFPQILWLGDIFKLFFFMPAGPKAAAAEDEASDTAAESNNKNLGQKTPTDDPAADPV